MDKINAIKSIVEYEKKIALEKVDYWKTAGVEILKDDVLGKKWCAFVEKHANNDFTRGALLDETLQVMKMIKSNESYDKIAQTLKEIPSGQTIIDVYLGMFIHPEILDEIKFYMNSNNNYKSK